MEPVPTIHPCAYRDPSVLNDDAKAAEFYSQYPELTDDSELTEDSPLAEEIIGQLICKRASCLLNFRIAPSHALRPGEHDAIEDVHWAVPSDCEWRNATNIREE